MKAETHHHVTESSRIVVACQKGGVGKSTLALNLLIEMIRRGRRAALWDADPQASCALMSAQRLRLHGQALPVVTEAPPDESGVVIVDTAPHADAELPRLLKQADALLTPTRPAVLDLAAAQTTLEVGRRVGIRLAAVLMLPTPRAPEIADARRWLAERGVPLAGVVHHRVDVARAAGEGLGIWEWDATHPGAAEFAAVADYVLALLCNDVSV